MAQTSGTVGWHDGSMRNALKRALKAVKLYRPAQYVQAILWTTGGRPPPPPHIIKQRTLIRYAERHQLRALIETGTFHGDMVEAMKRRFDLIVSIELSPHFVQKAKERFKADKNVEILCGDSSKLLKEVIKRVGQPALYWLDGHHSGGITARGDKDTPVMEELEHILELEDQSVILVDDARDFGTQPTYPAIDDLRLLVAARRPDRIFEVRDDIIRITPPRAAATKSE